MKESLEGNLKRLEDIGRLPYDWGEIGSRPFSQLLIKRCIQLVERFDEQPRIDPTPRNSIMMIFRQGKRMAEFEITSNAIFCRRIDDPVHKKIEGTMIEEALLPLIVCSFQDERRKRH